MDKIKNLLSPGHKEDDAKMYDTSSAGKQDTTQTGNLAGDTTHSAKNTPGSHHPRPGDDPSKVSEHMPGAFANTPRDEVSSSVGGLGGSHTTGTSSTAHHTANPAHSTTAAPASAAAAAASKPVHGSTTGHSSTHPPHATTAAPASAAAAAGTAPVHSGGAADDASTSSIKSGVTGGHSANLLPHSSTAASHAAPGSTGQVGSTAVHTTRETIGTPQGTSTVRSTTTTGLAPDGTPLHSHTQREREAAPHHGSSTGHSVGHSATHPSTGAMGTATVPASTSGPGAPGVAHNAQDPAFSNRTLGHDHYGSLDPTTTSTGVSSLGNFGRDQGEGATAYRPRGPHQDTHPIQATGAGAGAGGVVSTPHTTLPDRSRGGINEPGTQAAVGETSTYSSFPVGGEHVSGPHKTATANILDPHVAQPAIASSMTSSAPAHQTSSTHRGTGPTGASGTAAAVAGAVGATEHSKHSQLQPGPVGQTTTAGAPSAHGVVAQGGSAGVAGAGVAPGHHAQQTHSEAAAQKSITGDHSHGTEHTSRDQAAGGTAIPSSQKEHKTHQHPSETGSKTGTTGDQTKHHTSRDAAAASSGTGHTAGHTPLAGTNEGRNADLGEQVDKGPASKTMGPHSSNILNILDPRVKPDAAVQGSEKTNQLDSRVEGPTGAAGAGTSREKHQEQRAASGAHESTRSTSGATHNKGPEHTSTSETQRLSSDPARHGDTTAKGSHGHHGDTTATNAETSQGHDSGRHGISSLLHRDNPSKLHKDPPSK